MIDSHAPNQSEASIWSPSNLRTSPEVEPDIFPNPNSTGKMKAGQHKNPAYIPTRVGTLALAYAKKCD